MQLPAFTHHASFNVKFLLCNSFLLVAMPSLFLLCNAFLLCNLLLSMFNFSRAIPFFYLPCFHLFLLYNVFVLLTTPPSISPVQGLDFTHLSGLYFSSQGWRRIPEVDGQSDLAKVNSDIGSAKVFHSEMGVSKAFVPRTER